ncbi:MAG: Tad domain-containing protein [Bacteriovoracaceae bacterium]|nr:Tad domain-containing protein [Bacteriovoracaceae bacterium]
MRFGKFLKEQGQLTIFFAVSLMMFLSLVAFVINIGLYVKAKINLQNAVDAAAWSGAAVQARQLSNIAYLNWEMRNTYKEWMFKYWVLGNLSVDEVKDIDSGNGSLASAGDGKIQYMMRGGGGDPLKSDKYNFPSVCMHIVDAGGSSTDTPDICKMYNVPGVPEIGVTALPGADEVTQNFIDSIVQSKAVACSERTQLDFLVTMHWAYGVNRPSLTTTTGTLQQDAPQVALDRSGAWPKAFETAVRMRNLEHIVNFPPVENVCYSNNTSNMWSNAGISRNCTAIADFDNRNTPHVERTVKAFYSAYRNLASDEDDTTSTMKTSFVLTEIAPEPFTDSNQFSLSYLLYPTSAGRPEKHYLDLKLVLLNLATFYTSFIPKTGTIGASTASSAECAVTKMALPIPGYPFGYVKNSQVLTYYAVKGEALFGGLFNPFKNYFTKLTAYAAAKPFGGRIGPKLFETEANANTSVVTGRVDSKKRSNPYLIGLKGLSAIPNAYEFGDPVPVNPDFWISDPSQQIGGWISGAGIKFSVPNMIYDFSGNMNNHSSGASFTVIDPTNTTTTPAFGLYDAAQLQSFSRNLPEIDIGGGMGPTSIFKAILMARAPTDYEAANYLIPSIASLNAASSSDSFGTIVDSGSNVKTIDNLNYYKYGIFAPLFNSGADYLFKTEADINQVLVAFLATQGPAVDSYLKSMFDVAEAIRTKNGNDPRYNKAALMISDASSGGGTGGLTCDSIAGKMATYIMGTTSGAPYAVDGVTSACPKPFNEVLSEYFNDLATTGTQSDILYNVGEFATQSNSRSTAVLSRAGHIGYSTAFMPGQFAGAENNTSGLSINPFLAGSTSDNELMRRNFYSTKLIPLRSITQGNSGYNVGEIYSEGGVGTNAIFVNPLLNIDLSNISH